GNTVVSRYTAAGDRTQGDAASEQVVLTQEQPAANHNGGMLAFGPDGYLYIGLGDGGGANDTYGNGQNMNTFLGKILRIDVNGGDADNDQAYGIPQDNPFVNDEEARPEIWATGLRNPWRFSFDRETGDLYIGDVGQNTYEWVNYQPANVKEGRNYGWPITEGNHCFQEEECDRDGLTPPVLEYTHDEGCSITGGYVYRGEEYPALQGAYLFGDYCSGRLWTGYHDASGKWGMAQMAETGRSISSFGEDEAGELYLTDLQEGVVYRITARGR
ncbi:MAG: PQQ-dependent sugar dehydrogenase, partial [Chloroflexota bacterium]|nr:PQQ-dependent sugar dehydrogenase [Chloroflexota bacterium]